MDEKEQILNLINHYQNNLKRYSEKNDEEKMIYCINKLRKLPMTISYLQKTGVGKTVNGVRRMGGAVANAAKSVVSHWKEVVEKEGQLERHDENSSENEEAVCSQEEKETPRQEDEELYSHKKHHHVSKSYNINSSKHSHKESVNARHSKDKNSTCKEKGNSKKDSKEEDQKQYVSSEDSMDEKTTRSNKSYKRLDDCKSKTFQEESDERICRKRRQKSSAVEKGKDLKKKITNNCEDDKKGSSSVKKKSSEKVLEGGIDCGSGKSFAEALGMLEPSCSSRAGKKEKTTGFQNPSGKSSSSPSKQRKIDRDVGSSHSSVDIKTKSTVNAPVLINNQELETLDINFSSLLPEITPHYRPLGNYCDIQNFKTKKVTDDEALSAGITSKTQRTKVYSGNKCSWGKVTSLFELCIRVLQENIDGLEYTGGVPYSILRPVLERCNPDQLYTMEHYNPYLIEDTDEQWKYHCQREFRTKRREEMETWRDMYMRCLDEREAKLKALTTNIKQSQEKSQPVRQTMLAYVDSVAKPPRNVARKQAKNGINNDGINFILPSSRLSASTSATNGDAGKTSHPNIGNKPVNCSNSASGSHNAALKPKKAPLMQKALALIKNRYRR